MNLKEVTKRLFIFQSSVFNLMLLKAHKSKVGKNVVINGRLRLDGKGHLILGDKVRINSCRRFNPIGGNTFTSIYIKQGALVKIGDETGMSNVALYAAQCIEIGSHVKIGGNVSIYDTDFHSICSEERRLPIDPGVKTASIVIDDDVFIGAHSIILKGVSIGKRSVVAAGSVVTKNIPADELWGGTPAIFIKKLSGRDKVC